MKILKSKLFWLAIIAVIFLFPFYKNYLPQQIHDAKKYVLDKIELELALVSTRDFKIDNKIIPKKMVAHAGGGIKGLKYTNSLEALNQNYEFGFRFFEMDLNLTSDDQLVMLHDWNSGVAGLFGTQEGVRTLEEFEKLKMVEGLTQMTFAEVHEWMLSHEDAYFILDTKDNFKDTVLQLAQKYPDLKSRIIISINRFKEYKTAVKLGFQNIIFSLYVSEYGLTYSDQNVLRFVGNTNLTAVVLPVYRTEPEFVENLNKQVFVYVFTVDDESEKQDFENRGVQGFYTNFLKVK